MAKDTDVCLFTADATRQVQRFTIDCNAIILSGGLYLSKTR